MWLEAFIFPFKATREYILVNNTNSFTLSVCNYARNIVEIFLNFKTRICCSIHEMNKASSKEPFKLKIRN